MGSSPKRKNNEPSGSTSPYKDAATSPKRQRVDEEAASESFVVHYFNLQGKAELIRILLAYGGAVWTDSFTEDWQSMKPTTPFGQLPLLVESEAVTGKEVFRLAQSHAIARYLGHKFDLIPSNAHEAAFQDSVFESVSDLENAFSKANHEKDEKAKKSLTDAFYNEKLAAFLTFNEKHLAKNKNSGHFVGKKMTLADIYAFSVFERLEHNKDERLAKQLKTAPCVHKLLETVRKTPKLKEYLEGARAPVVWQG
ncbi:glutathione S-transferase [Obelidium mucronatum]|nr:glutathione S-transferase [Obelidium mucronatum]